MTDFSFEKSIVPISSKDREAYPNAIYLHESSSPLDRALTYASYVAMRDCGFDIGIDFEKSNRGGDHKVIVRAKNLDRQEQSAQAALFLGLTEATRRRLEAQTDVSVKNPDNYFKQACLVATELAHDLVDNQELFKDFSDYYGGLRWGTDQERFTNVFFAHGTDFDPEFIAANLTGRDLGSLVYKLDLDVPYEKRKNFDTASPERILRDFPELDYRNLQDEEFLNSDYGQVLLRAYAELSGDILANRFRQSESVITPDGVELPRPLIPLSRFPIIEALMIDEVSLDRPKPKYSFGPNEIRDIILRSDSTAAINSLVRSINTRLPEGQRRPFDGPDEFEYKHRMTVDLLRQYRTVWNDPEQRQVFKESILTVMDAYTGNGEIAESVRGEYAKAVARGAGDYATGDLYKVKEIVSSLIEIALAAPDGDLINQAEELIAIYVPSGGKSIVREIDPLSLTRADLMLTLLDSLNLADQNSHPDAFESVGRQVFADPEVAGQLRDFASTLVRIDKIRKTPKVLLALAHWRKFSHAFDDKEKRQNEAARSAYEKVLVPATQLSENLRQARNKFLLEYLNGLNQNGSEILDDRGQRKVFSGLVKRVEISHYNMRELPEEYFALITLAETPELDARLKGDIVWHIAQKFEYVDDTAAGMMIPAVLDICRVMLGPVGNTVMPTAETDHGLAAAAFLVRKHGHSMFKKASSDQLETLETYSNTLKNLAVQVAADELLPEKSGERPAGNYAEWKKQTLDNIRNAAREFNEMSEYYKGYLHIEAVKVKPSIYYPWLLGKLAPFWQKMQWEVGPGNQPRSDIRHLFATLQDYIKNRLVIREGDYPDRFNAIDEGQLDTFLLEMYRQMIVPHDIKYNTTVWQEGLSFMHYSVAYMPDTLLKEIVAKHRGSDFAAYLEREHKRWNREENVI